MKKKNTLPSSSQNYTDPAVYYPVFLNLKKKMAVVVGGGKVAERKILALLKTGADITVISPEITRQIEKMKFNRRIKHISRSYRKGDLKNAFLVIAATNSQVINERISHDSSCLVNVVDTPHLCNFIVPSVIKRQPLTIAVSTSGISPALSRFIRKELEILYGPEFSEYLKSLRSVRSEAMRRIRDQRERNKFLKSVASEKIVRMLREKGCKEAKSMVKNLLKNSKTYLTGKKNN